VEISSRLSTTGESPLYDLRFRGTQSRHIVRFDLTWRYKKQRCARDRHLRGSARCRQRCFRCIDLGGRAVTNGVDQPATKLLTSRILELRRRSGEA